MQHRALAQLVEAAAATVAPAIVLRVERDGELLLEAAAGTRAPEEGDLTPVDPLLRFDLASLTKLATATAALRLVEQGELELDAPVRSVLAEVSGRRTVRAFRHPVRGVETFDVVGAEVDAGSVTFRQLLAHSSGLPAWLPGHERRTREEALRAIVACDFAARPGARTIYSDIGFTLLGEAIARAARRPLDEVVRAEVLAPLGMHDTGYLPLAVLPDGRPTGARPEGTLPTERCAWRGRRVWGEVHDENAARLGGVAGHAGLFGTARDVARLGRLYLQGGVDEGARLLAAARVADAIQVQPGGAPGDEPRGLGWQLRPSDGTATVSAPLSPCAYGHTGFTGTSLWVDPARRLVVVLLTNRVYHGRERPGIVELRTRVHEEVARAVA